MKGNLPPPGKAHIQIGENAWEGLGDLALLEEVCLWGLALRFQKPPSGPVCFSLCGVPADQDVTLVPCLPAVIVMD